MISKKENHMLQELVNTHDFYIEGPLTHPYESIHMGNGDIGASVNLFPHELKITLAKSDIWDAKFNGDPEASVLKHDDLIDLMNRVDRDLKDEEYNFGSDYYNFWFQGDGNHGPYPKRAGAIRIYHPGLSNTKCSAHLDIYTGMLTAKFKFPAGELIVKAFLENGTNRVWVTVEGSGSVPWVGLILEKEPDDVDRHIPMPDIGWWGDSIREIGILTQKIPGGFGVDDFQWSLAGGFPQAKDGIDVDYVELHAYRCRYYCSVSEGKRAIFCVGVATSTDGEGDTAERAAAMTMNRSEADYEAAWASNKKLWDEFWNKANINLYDDKELESAWYRNHYGYNCIMNAAVIPIGEAANLSIQDSIPWRGDYHINHNFQKWFVTALPTNNPHWIELYADFIEQKTETFEYTANLIFGLEGAYCDLAYFPHVPKEHCCIGNYFGRALALTGWAVQPLWHYYEYMLDKEWLGRRAYPFMKKAAEFYSNYMDKYVGEDGVIFPSVRLEEPGWNRGFKGNRNVLTDLVMFKKCFERTIKAAEVLDLDADLRKRWQENLDKVSPLKYGWENGEGYVEMDVDMYCQPDGEKAEAIRVSRWGGGGWAVYPGEYIDGDENCELAEVYRDMMRRTNLQDPFVTKTGYRPYGGTPIIHPISSIIPTIRLGVTEQFESIKEIILAHRMTYGQASSYRLAGNNMPEEIFTRNGWLWYDWRSVENKYLGVYAVTEMLLQSQGGIIRLFPYYPTDSDVDFKGFRARGGFIVSAERKGNEVNAVIESEAGEQVKLKSFTEPIKITCDNEDVPYVFDQNIIRLDTKPGSIYNISLPTI